MTDSIDGISGMGSTSGAGSSPFTQARQDAMTAAAGELGMSTTDLRSAMASGQTLDQIAASKGVSSTDLKNTIEASLKKDMPNASSSQIDGMASRMMSGAHGHHGGGHHATSASSATSSDSSGTDGSTDGNNAGSSVNLIL